jgi:hypothetical protein
MSELWSHRVPLALLSLVVLGLLVWLPRRVVPARGLALLRCLLPSWRFFEQLEPVPALQLRSAPAGDDWGAWQEALTVPARPVSSLWLNAAGNLNFACQSLVEHLVVELEEAAELGQVEHELVSYRLICALCEVRLREARAASPALRYQFRLAAAEASEVPLFLSRVHAAS